VSKADWGVKRLCQSCGAKFYDMNKDPIACPSCGTTFDPESQRSKRSRPSAKAAKPAATKTAVLKEKDPVADDADSDGADLVADDDLDSDTDAGADPDDDILAPADDLDDDDEIPGVPVAKDDEET